MNKTFNIIYLKNHYSDALKEMTNDKVSFTINGIEEYNTLVSSKDEIYFLKKHIDKIKRINFKFNNINNSFKDCDFRDFKFLEDNNIETRILFNNGFYEDSISNYLSSRKKIKDLVKNIISRNDTLEDKIIKIISWITQNISYNKKYNVNMETEENKKLLKERLLISHILCNKETNCAGFSNILYALLEEISVNSKQERSKWHMWNSIFINGKKRHIDCTILNEQKEKDSEFKVNKYNYFVDNNKIENYGLYTGIIGDTYFDN